MDLIRFQKVTKKYKNGVVAVNDVSLSIEKGDFVFIIGSTGCGKSSLIKMLYREEKPTSGKILVGGIDVAKLKNWKVFKIRRKIGVVFQDYKLLPKLTVYENVAYPLESYGEAGSEIKKKVLNALDRVGLKDKYRSYPHELSGGEQQRVCIARAIVNEPKLIICDEPTGNLDPDTSKEIMDVITNINKELETTVVMATHDKDIVNRLKKRVITIKNGVIVSDKKKGKYDDEADKNI